MQTSTLVWFVLIYYSRKTTNAYGSIGWMLYRASYTEEECFVSNTREFCHPIQAVETFGLCHGGDSWTFRQLADLNVTLDNLVDWLIPFDLIEDYVAYLNDDETESNVQSYTRVCNCSLDWIGRQCEYRFNSKVDHHHRILDQQLVDLEINSHGIITTLIDGIICKGANIFLEWRHICDGIAQCQNGVDEHQCHFLEFHKCESDEYQCRNGMCIPIESAFDGALDCLDRSDEQRTDTIENHDLCPTKSTYDCDERFCQKDQFSCGDGECVHWSSLLYMGKGCRNWRHVAYNCETSKSMISLRLRQWPGICRETMESVPYLTSTSRCLDALRHLLQNKLEQRMTDIAITIIKSHCDEWILYSTKNSFFPGFHVLYNRSRIETFFSDKKNLQKLYPSTPDLFYFTGNISCNGMELSTSEKIWFTYEQLKELISYPFFPLIHIICQRLMNQSSSHTATSKDNTRSDSYQCLNTTDIISLRRINDGYIDCLHGDDERNPNYLVSGPFKFRCETVPYPFQYVSYAQLGDGTANCIDRSDELSTQLDWSFFKCNSKDGYECWTLQGDRFGENRLKDARLHFQRHCDTFWNVMNGEDEKYCSQWICGPGLRKCNRTGQCVDVKYICDDEFDCYDGEDELNCSVSIQPWSFEEECVKGTEFFCITPTYVKNQTMYRPCIPRSQVGDGHIDCIGARDERNVKSCPDFKMIGDRFLCDKETKCIEYSDVCNGIDDCDDRTDELICYWNKGQCARGQYPCADGISCRSVRCATEGRCPNRSHRFWCPNNVTAAYVYRERKSATVTDARTKCLNTVKSPVRLSIVSPMIKEQSITEITSRSTNLYYLCNRGFYLTNNMSSGFSCFCPPTYYGDRCQFMSRQVSVQVRLDRWHRTDIPIILNIVVMLVLNDTFIVHHQTFSDESKAFPGKNTVNLFYSRPKLAGIYSVRIEAYHAIRLIHFWEFPISPLDFLPVFRITKLLRFPDHELPRRCSQNHCQNNGTCYENEKNKFLCICSRYWKGKFCEIRMQHVKCAPHSLARTEHLCICPHGYVEPHCYIPNLKCRNTSCSGNETCAPVAQIPVYKYLCFCNSTSCVVNVNRTLISLHRHSSNSLPLLLQLLELAGDYPAIRQQILIQPGTIFPVIQSIKTRDYRQSMGMQPEVGLLFTFEWNNALMEIKTYLLYINCSNSQRNYTVDLNSKQLECQILPEEYRYSTTLFLNFCETLLFGKCFIAEGYLCYCDFLRKSQRECLSYKQRYGRCKYCQNQGHCIEGDLVNRTDFFCLCPDCVDGVLCQFSYNRFSISLELLMEKNDWGPGNFFAPVVLVLLGTLFISLSLTVFVEQHIRQSGVGIHFLSISICSLFVILFFFFRVTYLYVMRRINIGSDTSVFMCKSLPFLMYTFYFISLWLMAIVSVERALAAVQYSRLRQLQKPSTSFLLLFFIILVVSCSNFMMITQYELISHPDYSYPWCIREIEPKQQILVQLLSMSHQLIPFLVNIIAALVIIMTIARSKAHIQRNTTLASFKHQIREHFDLLLGPVVCFLTQLPQITILFLNTCDYEETLWFFKLTLVAYYLSFIPHTSIFFLYILPSKQYRNVFIKNTQFGKYISTVFISNEVLFTRK